MDRKLACVKRREVPVQHDDVRARGSDCSAQVSEEAALGEDGETPGTDFARNLVEPPDRIAREARRELLGLAVLVGEVLRRVRLRTASQHQGACMLMEVDPPARESL
jgi:hypothetical protein